MVESNSSISLIKTVFSRIFTVVALTLGSWIVVYAVVKLFWSWV